jgi:DNA-binding transcriptional regulator YdaS (Cro superfamily)
MLNISIRQMHTLLAIQKHGKISAAAKSLGLTSPAVTLQIAATGTGTRLPAFSALQIRRATDRDRRDRHSKPRVA